MKIVRPAKEEDLEGLWQCALQCGMGVTHLPKDRNRLQKKIELSMHSFAKKVSSPHNEEYLFVFVDLTSQKIEGTCAIFAQTGARTPSMLFEIDHLPPLPHHLPRPQETRVLHRKVYHESGPTEVGGLYLLPDVRHSGHGKLLSWSRFLFIASQPHRVTDRVMANMRGIIENNKAPFWDCVGRSFLEMEFEEMMELRAEDESLFLSVIPEFPLPVSLIPKAADLIGKVHQHTVPAYEMLREQGFSFANEIDPYDGGPILSCQTEQIKTVCKTERGMIAKVSKDPFTGSRAVLATYGTEFRACLGSIGLLNGKIIISSETANGHEIIISSETANGHEIIISSETANGIDVKEGDFIYYAIA